MDFEKNWVRIMSDQDRIKVEIAEGVLKQHGIISHVVNNTVSAIPSIGDAELHVHEENVEVAKNVLKDADLI